MKARARWAADEVAACDGMTGLTVWHTAALMQAEVAKCRPQSPACQGCAGRVVGVMKPRSRVHSRSQIEA